MCLYFSVFEVFSFFQWVKWGTSCFRNERMTSWKVDASGGEAGQYPVAFVLCAPCERYVVEQNRNAECGGGNDCPRTVSRHTRRHLSIETWRLWMLEPQCCGLWVNLQENPSVFLRSGFSPCCYSRLKSVGLGHLFPEQRQSWSCDPQQLV